MNTRTSHRKSELHTSQAGVTCTLLPGSFAHGKQVPILYNAVYRHWKQTWGEVFTRSGSPQSLCAENFLRQNIIITLHQGQSVIGVLATTIFNLSSEACFDHPYFKPFPETLIDELKCSAFGRALTGEYLSVCPDYRKSIVGVAFSEVLIGLLVKTFNALNGEILLATTVRPARVHESCMKFGYVELGSYEKYGLDCVLLKNTQRICRQSDDARQSALIEQLWSNRTDLTGLTLHETEQQKAA